LPAWTDDSYFHNCCLSITLVGSYSYLVYWRVVEITVISPWLSDFIFYQKPLYKCKERCMVWATLSFTNISNVTICSTTCTALSHPTKKVNFLTDYGRKTCIRSQSNLCLLSDHKQ
jgi:hypothetical protein